MVSLQAQWRVIIEIRLTFRADFCRCNDFSCPGDICYHILTQMSRKTKKLCACARVFVIERRYTMITTYYCADGACFLCLKIYSFCENNQWLPLDNNSIMMPFCELSSHVSNWNFQVGHYYMQCPLFIFIIRTTSDRTWSPYVFFGGIKLIWLIL